jgi:hypothetical protein
MHLIAILSLKLAKKGDGSIFPQSGEQKNRTVPFFSKEPSSLRGAVGDEAISKSVIASLRSQ